jgi:hypothetical protein
LPDTYHSAGLRRGTATLKFYEDRDILRRDVPAVLLEPRSVFQGDVKNVVADCFVTAADLCPADLRAECDRAGIR